MWRRLVVLVIASCGAPPPPFPAARPAPVVAGPVAVPYTPPRGEPVPPFRIECHAFTPVPGAIPRGTKTYDFAPMSLAPIRRGPHIADRPRANPGRTTRDLRLLFARAATDITNCWKAQSSRGAEPTTLTVGVTIEPLGGTRDLTVTSERVADEPLATCVTSALTGSALDDTTARPIHLTAQLVFERADQPAWKRVWPTPGPGSAFDPRRGTMCTHVIEDGVIPQVELPKPLAITDWDDSRDPPQRNAVPQIRIGCSQTYLDTDKHAIRTAVRSNFGALQGCYADAIERDPNLAGDVSLQMTFAHGGNGSPARFTGGVGDPPLHACLAAALQELWVSPGPMNGTSLEINLTFTLTPLPSSPAPADDPVALLAAGDPEAALRAWTTKLSMPVSLEVACRGRAGVLLAIADIAPWLDDARVYGAIKDLGASAALLAPPTAHACVAPVTDTIQSLTRARGQPYPGARMTHEWLQRYAAALPLAPYLDDGATLRWHHAEALFNSPQRATAMKLLEKLAWDPKIGAAVLKELDDRKRSPTEPISDRCGN